MDELASDSGGYEPPKKVLSKEDANSSAASTVTVLQERLQNYRSGYEIARSSGDSSKSRRAERGIKVGGMLDLPVLTLYTALLSPNDLLFAVELSPVGCARYIDAAFALINSCYNLICLTEVNYVKYGIIL